ncbi:MAG: serine hydrolase domain-containing protein [Acidobacteriota bacterium]
MVALCATAQAPVANPSQTAPSAAPAAAATPPPAAPSGNHPLDEADLQAFFDGIVPLQLERSDIAGASVLVMQNGTVLLQKGYGFADWKARKPVDPETTIFRLASISKLFTWIAVMQLVEQGRLNLDTDVNRYLDFQIRPAFGRPVTLRNLMTHTGGFEESFNNILRVNPATPLSLRADLIESQPMRIYPPGQIPAYSNYGVGLAGYIVQRVSGEPFQRYVERHIFAPLGMTHSTFDQPLPKDLSGLASEGYRKSTLDSPVGFEIFQPLGAGGVSSTAADMGRFGQMLLGGGTLDGKQILKPETLAQMWTPQYQANPALPPLCMGFYQEWRNNLRWIGHEGDLIAFHSLFFVEPTQKIVLFVSYNSAGGESIARPEIVHFFSDRYFPGAPPATAFKAPLGQLKAIEGEYQSSRRVETTRAKAEYLFGQVRATVNKDGILKITGLRDLRGHTIEWKAIGKDLWQRQNGQERVFGLRDARGRITRIALDFPGVQLVRVPWYENSTWVLPALGASLGALLLVVLAGLVRTFHRLFFRRRPRPAPQPNTAWVSWGARLAAFVWVTMGAAIGVFFAAVGDTVLPPTPAWFPWFVAMNWVTGVGLALSLWAMIEAVLVWWRYDLLWITKLKYSLVGAACAFVSWFAVHWHLIGPAHRI